MWGRQGRNYFLFPSFLQWICVTLITLTPCVIVQISSAQLDDFGQMHTIVYPILLSSSGTLISPQKAALGFSLQANARLPHPQKATCITVDWFWLFQSLIKMESYRMYPFVPGFFCSGSCFWDSRLLLGVLVLFIAELYSSLWGFYNLFTP